ncbi:serine/threonine-protein kinase [Metapseudomonas boanensis]|uniref:Protein kinase n=1 Tax=Metapseudomonas boanensis TaxID=2822138 RepID=A0ABS5XK55_9GAMM|nr:protein kinase [Pseudomonas boanensis]MBT8768084.1 protein kinase [Pseudomonas boanensis]
MPLQLLEHPAVSLAQGHGLDLPNQAARARATWVAGRQGRPPLLLVALLWGRRCINVVQVLNLYLDALFADYSCTPDGWSEAQAARQVLAALNLQLFRRRRAGEPVPELSAGLLLVQDGEAHFLQAGAIGLVRIQGDDVHCLVGRENPLGVQAELAVVQHSLPLVSNQPLLLAPQPLLEVADLRAFKASCDDLQPGRLGAVLEPLLGAPGAAAIVLPGEPDNLPPPSPCSRWPRLENVIVGARVDGWTVQAPCGYGSPGRMFLARDEEGRDALFWAADTDADEAFWQREWVLRRSPVPSLPQVLSPRQPRHHAFLLFQFPSERMRSMTERLAADGPWNAKGAMALLVQLIEAVRSLQRRGMQGLWLDPRQILVADDGRVLLLPEFAAILPGVSRQVTPQDAVPLAPELRHGRALDGSADQFALASLTYWMLCGRWPEVACPEGGQVSRYVPLVGYVPDLPAGWDGVLARALAPQPRARFEALSEFQQALERPLAQVAREPVTRQWTTTLHLALIMLIGLLVSFGLWLGW